MTWINAALAALCLWIVVRGIVVFAWHYRTLKICTDGGPDHDDDESLRRLKGVQACFTFWVAMMPISLKREKWYPHFMFPWMYEDKGGSK